MQENKGRVCVTGGTGFLGSWMVKRLLEDGYSVNATVRLHPERKRDINFITNLPGASERLQIFHADLDHPESFAAAIYGCAGVFHTAPPQDLTDNESEEVKTKRAITSLQGILQAAADSKTVKRVLYTSSISAVMFNPKPSSGPLDETSWSDVDFIRSLNVYASSSMIANTSAERAAFDLADKLGLDLVSVLPTRIIGPFICPNLPKSVYVSLVLVFGDEGYYEIVKDSSLVHVDDVARAHIHLFEHPEAKGRYIVSAIDSKIEEMYELISDKYPEYKMPSPDSWKDIPAISLSGISRKKLLESGFKYENGLEEMFAGAIKSCKEKGFL